MSKLESNLYQRDQEVSGPLTLESTVLYQLCRAPRRGFQSEQSEVEVVRV